MPRVRSKRWCITLNNYTEEEESQLQSLVETRLCSYILYGREVGQQGTPHLQMYLETKKKVGLRSIKTMPGLSRAHVEKANGSLQSNQRYCRKEGGTVYEEGEPMQQGKRNDLLEIQSKIDSGVTVEVIAEENFSKWVVYRRSFEAYAALKIPQRTWKSFVHVLWGKTGTGKTRFAHDQARAWGFWGPGDFKWFDGYKGQEIVIIDDFRGEYPLPLLLKLLDRYPMQVPVKGSFVSWCPKKVFITSNVDPLRWYPLSDSMSVDALMRRLDKVEEIKESLF